jgi:hypothetical protein
MAESASTIAVRSAQALRCRSSQRSRLRSVAFAVFLTVLLPLAFAVCGEKSPTSPSRRENASIVAASHLGNELTNLVVEAALPEGQERYVGGFLGLGPARAMVTCGSENFELPVPPGAPFTLIGVSTITRNGTTVSGSNRNVIGGFVDIEGEFVDATLHLRLRGVDDSIGLTYTEEWNATVRSEGSRYLLSGQSSGSRKLNDGACVTDVTWSGIPLTGEILSAPPPAPSGPVPAPSPGPAPGPTPGPGPVPVPSDGGTMTATIDGVPWTGRITVASIATGNNLVVSGTGSPGITTIALSSPAQVGTQTVGSTSPLVGSLIVSPTVGWLAAGPIGSGTMTISTLTETSATGTFSFTLVPNLGSGPNKIVTNGTFNAVLPTPRP